MEERKQKETKNTGQGVLISIMISALLPTFLSSSVNIALPSIGKEFGMNVNVLGWVSTAYVLAAAAFLIPFGKVADIIGRKKIFFGGVLLLTMASVLCGVSGNGWQLILFRTIQGVGGSMLSSTGIAIIGMAFPKENRGKALGMIGVTTYLGMSMGPLIGGILTENFGWRSIFVVSTVLGISLIYIVLRFMVLEKETRSKEQFDAVGSVLYCISVISFLAGASFLRLFVGKALIGLGAVLFAGLMLWCNNKKSPVLDFRVFQKNRIFLQSIFTASINYSITFVLSYLLSIYFQYVRGLSPQTSGLILIIQPAVQSFFSPFAGRMSDKMEPRRVSAWGLALNGLGLCVFLFAGANTSIVLLGVGLILEGIGCALFVSPNQNAVMGSVTPAHYGIASGILATMRFIGQVLSMAIATVCASIYIGSAQISSHLSVPILSTMHLTLSIMMLLCLTGITLLFMGKGEKIIS